MQVICDATQSSTAEEYVIWLEILVKIGSLYYMHLLRYMDSVIFPVSRIYIQQRLRLLGIIKN
jgi:hypothetical protein